MRVIREGKLIESRLNTGDILSLELGHYDAEELIKHSAVTNRFMEFPALVAGWAMEDKVHVRLEDRLDPDDYNNFAELSLDTGGDLYYTLWKSERLLRAGQCEVFDDLSVFVRNDPSSVLDKLGITAARIYGLPTISYVLNDLI